MTRAGVISRKSTPIAVLRHTLGPYDGQEDVFAATVDCSVSWVKKVSAGLRNITPQTARLVSMATGVSEEWLLKGDPKAPILERDSVTLYTRDSYERWRRKTRSVALANRSLVECGSTRHAGQRRPSIRGNVHSRCHQSGVFCAGNRQRTFGTQRPLEVCQGNDAPVRLSKSGAAFRGFYEACRRSSH